VERERGRIAGKFFKNLLLPCLHLQGRRSCTVPFKMAPCIFFLKKIKKKFESDPKLGYDTSDE
jgi:hypothetical protein